MPNKTSPETKELELKPRPEGTFSAAIETAEKKVMLSRKLAYIMLKLSDDQGFINIYNRAQIKKMVRQVLTRNEAIPELKNEQDLLSWLNYLISNHTPFAFIRKWRKAPERELYEDNRFA